MARILIKGGEVFDGEKFILADILTDGEKIAKIEADIKEHADFIYDATGKTVSAGLVDIHTHMLGISSEEFGTHIESGCFPFGVTAAADASGVMGDAGLLDSFMIKSCVFVAVDIRNNAPCLEKAIERLEKFGERAVGVKVYFDTTQEEVKDITPLKKICEFARKKGLRVMVHCSHSPSKMSEILNTLSAGDILTHAYHGGENNSAEESFKSIEEAKARGVIIDAGMAGHVHTDTAVLRLAADHGAFPSVISTDLTRLSVFKRGGRYGLTMCMSIFELLGMPRTDIFKAVTKNDAAAIGRCGELGELSVGGYADIAVFDKSYESFELIGSSGDSIKGNTSYRCTLTVSSGEVVYRS